MPAFLSMSSFSAFQYSTCSDLNSFIQIRQHSKELSACPKKVEFWSRPVILCLNLWKASWSHLKCFDVLQLFPVDALPSKGSSATDGFAREPGMFCCLIQTVYLKRSWSSKPKRCAEAIPSLPSSCLSQHRCVLQVDHVGMPEQSRASQPICTRTFSSSQFDNPTRCFFLALSLFWNSKISLEKHTSQHNAASPLGAQLLPLRCSLPSSAQRRKIRFEEDLLNLAAFLQGCRPSSAILDLGRESDGQDCGLLVGSLASSPRPVKLGGSADDFRAVRISIQWV